jgi:hypothetical protein
LKLSDLTGQVKISARHACTFVSTWFDPDDNIAVVGRRSVKTGHYDTVSQSMKASEFCQMDDDMLESLIFEEDGTKRNLYLGVAPIKEHVTIKQRGNEENVTHVTGVWADLDIKDNSFKTRDEILAFLFGEIKFPPTIVVASGSGGIHAYWKLAPGLKGNKELVERWWAYLDEAAGERKIDKLVDLTRILRIPGTVYFPKPDSSAKIGSVEILYLIDRTYTIEEIKEVTEEAFRIKHERRKKLISQDANRRMDMDTFARTMLAGMGGNKWKMWRAISELENYVNDHMSWAEILEPHGWTWQRTLRDGSNEWARPGRDERSAVVDYEDSPVMSLLSMAPETRLDDLKDAHIPITKYRAFLRLQFNDNEAEMVKHLIGRLEKDGII